MAEQLKKSSMGLRQLPKLSTKDLSAAKPDDDDDDGGGGGGGSSLSSVVDGVRTGIKKALSMKLEASPLGDGGGPKRGSGGSTGGGSQSEVKEDDPSGKYVELVPGGGFAPPRASGMVTLEEGFAEDHFAELTFEVRAAERGRGGGRSLFCVRVRACVCVCVCVCVFRRGGGTAGAMSGRFACVGHKCTMRKAGLRVRVVRAAGVCVVSRPRVRGVVLTRVRVRCIPVVTRHHLQGGLHGGDGG